MIPRFVCVPTFVGLALLAAPTMTLAQAHAHTETVMCLHCAGGVTPASEGDNDELSFFRIGGRWATTAAGSTGVRGDPVTLTYGIVPDGTAIGGTAVTGESTSGSNLVSFLNTQIGASTIWLPLFQQSYGRWGEISGLNMVYKAQDDGVAMGGSGSFSGSAARPDMRIGWRFLDGQSGSNVLAYNYYPNNGDQVMDTSNVDFFKTTTNNYRNLRNVVMHEAGHGLGFNHFESNNTRGLMEPFIDTTFDGPQHDDILAAQRNYGDALEKNGGNDTIATATPFGTILPSPSPVLKSIGTHAKDNTVLVLSTESDYISIDGTSDVDVYSFTLGGTFPFLMNATLAPKGPTYNEGSQGGTQTALNTKALADLQLQILNSLGTILYTASAFGAGINEVIEQTLLPGSYYARVSTATESPDNIQMYRLDLEFTTVPEPGVLAGVSVALLVIARRRRHARV